MVRLPRSSSMPASTTPQDDASGRDLSKRCGTPKGSTAALEAQRQQVTRCGALLALYHGHALAGADCPCDPFPHLSGDDVCLQRAGDRDNRQQTVGGCEIRLRGGSRQLGSDPDIALAILGGDEFGGTSRCRPASRAAG